MSLCRRTFLFSLALASLAAASVSAAPQTVRVGIMGGEDEELWELVAREAASRGLAVKLVVFNDYTQPNEALDRGELDANAFQHKPYLDNQIATRGYKIVPAGYTAVWPIGLYSRKYKAVAELPERAVIGVPNDPSNAGRGLKLLEHEGLIALQPESGILATAADIVRNPKHVRIRELDAGIIGRAVPDLDAAVVNTDWALKAGLSPSDRLATESLAENPYRNFIAVQAARKDEPWVAKLVASYQTDATRDALARIYKGTAQPAW